jgi:thiamine biosynthesis lipoprotein
VASSEQGPEPTLPGLQGAFWCALILGAASLAGCSRSHQQSLTLSGEALGTQWVVVLSKTPKDLAPQALQTAVEAQLDRLNQVASDWIPDSELSRLNAWLAAGLPRPSMQLSPELTGLLSTSDQAHGSTAGCFDPTVGELVWALGFGSKARPEPLTAGPELEAIQARLGWPRLHFDAASGTLDPEPGAAQALDLSGVAKGAAVDWVAAELERLGCRDFLVEVGGELVLRGQSPRGDLWRQGVDKPTSDPQAAREPALRFACTGRGVATSGDYRQWQQVDSERFSHVVDPRVGQPARSKVASVTVLAPTCALADAFATGLMVLGSDAGLKALQAIPGIEALFMEYGAGELLRLSASPGFPQIELAPEFKRLVAEPWPAQIQPGPAASR